MFLMAVFTYVYLNTFIYTLSNPDFLKYNSDGSCALWEAGGALQTCIFISIFLEI